MSKTITLERFAYAPDGTFGRLTLPDGWSCFTVERPWESNEPFESCIPDGVYRLARRRSPVVERTSGGDYLEGWEVTNVPGRSYIMIHPANWPRNVEGCIGVGKKYMVMQGANGNGHTEADIVLAFRDAVADELEGKVVFDRDGQKGQNLRNAMNWTTEADLYRHLTPDQLARCMPGIEAA